MLSRKIENKSLSNPNIWEEKWNRHAHSIVRRDKGVGGNKGPWCCIHRRRLPWKCTHGWNNRSVYCLTVPETGNLNSGCQHTPSEGYEKRIYPKTFPGHLVICWQSLAFLDLQTHHPISSFIFTWHSRCMCVSVSKFLLFIWAWIVLEEGMHCLTSLHLQQPHFQIRYHSEALEVRTSYINPKKTNLNHQQRLWKSSGLSFSRTEHLTVSVLLRSHPR